MRLPLCASLVLAAAVVLRAAINVGDPYNKVLKEMGPPPGRIESGNTVSLHYPERIIKLERGRVVALEAPRPRENGVPETKPAAPAAERRAPVSVASAKPRSSTPAGSNAGRWTTDYDAALRDAKAQKRRVLLFFTGSDWSGDCMRLRHEILSTQAFARYASEHLVLVEVEFPKNRKLPPMLQAQNDALRHEFGIQTLPRVVILDSAGQRLGMLGYLEGGPQAYIAELQKL